MVILAMRIMPPPAGRCKWSWLGVIQSMIQAGLTSQSGGRMGFARTDAAEEIDVGLVFDEVEQKEVLRKIGNTENREQV